MDCDDTIDDASTGEWEAASSLLAEFDPETDSATETIVMTVAGHAEVGPNALDPLYSVVDPEALDRIIRSVAARSTPGNAEIIFRYQGYTVSVHSHGVIEIAPIEGS